MKAKDERSEANRPPQTSLGSASESNHVEQELQRRTHLLTERVKELNCLYSLSKLADCQDMTVEGYLQRTVEIIPDAWQYPEVTCARIRLEGRDFCSDNFVDTVWKQQAPIVVHGAPVGLLEVCYIEERPESDEGPFIKEERNLIDAIAQRLGEVTGRKWAEEQLIVYQAQLRSLAGELVRAEERERRQFACDLHDRIGQSLATVRMKLSLLIKSQPSGPIAQALQDIQTLVIQAVTDTRTLIFDLSPPILYEFGLNDALEWLAEEIGKQYSLSVAFEEQGESTSISEELRVATFRSARELLINAAKHAKARHARLSVYWDANSLRVLVEDDGVGFDPMEVRRRGVQEGSFGLFSISERLEPFGAEIQIYSEPGAGTQVSLEIPLTDGTTESGA